MAKSTLISFASRTCAIPMAAALAALLPSTRAQGRTEQDLAPPTALVGSLNWPHALNDFARLPNGRVAFAYPSTRLVIGAKPPYLAHVEPFLPPGLTVLSSGRLVGIPRVAGDFRFTVSISDASSPPQIVRQAFRLRIVGRESGRD